MNRAGKIAAGRGHPKGVTDRGLRHLSGLAELKGLSLYGLDITDAGVESLRALTALEELEVGFPLKFEGSALAALKTIPRLKRLGIGSASFDEKNLIYLKDAQELEELICAHGVTDVGMRYLAPLKKLKRLTVGDGHVTNAGLEPLKDLKDLERLYLSKARVSARGLEQLKNMTRLKVLDLSEDPALDDDAMPAIGAHVSLTSLKLTLGRISDDGLKQLQGLRHLAELDLTNTMVSDEGLEYLHRFEHLRRLSLPSTITDQGLKRIAYLPNLESIDLNSTQITADGLALLIKQFPALKTAVVANTKTTDQEQSDFFHALERKSSDSSR